MDLKIFTGAMLRQAREQAGISLLSMSKRANFSKSHLGNIETGQRAVTIQVVEAYDRETGSAGALVGLFNAEKVTATNRRQFLALAGIGLMDMAPKRIGASDIDSLRARFARLRDLDNYLGGADTFPLYSTELAYTEHVLSHGHYGLSTQRALADLAAEQAQQAGWAAFDAGHITPALQMFEYSRHVAREAGNESLVANALVHIAYATRDATAVDAANAACQAINGNALLKTRALLESRRAWSYALVGDAYHAAQALDEARGILIKDGEGEAPHWASWVDSTEIDIMTGRVWAVLRSPAKAIPPLESALADYPDQWSRDKALYLTWLADAYLDAGNTEEAESTLDRAITLAQKVASVRPAGRVTQTVRRMEKLGLAKASGLAERIAAITPTIPDRL